jgi:CRP-like cAMP-binding protein
MSQDLDALRNFIARIHPLDDSAWTAFSEHWQPYIARRRTLLTAAGETERFLYFVLDGVQRAFYLSDRGREATIVFTYPPSFSGVPDSLLTGLPSSVYFETLTASRFLRLRSEHLVRLMEDFPAVKTMVMKSLAHALHGVLKRQAEVQVASSEEKFRALMARSPHLLHLVPHKYIASYLGIDATNFSKLLGNTAI